MYGRSAFASVLTCALLSAGCGAAVSAAHPASGASASSEPELSRSPSAARQLASLLPAHAQRCVVTRPAQLAPQVRAGMAGFSQASGLPWTLEVPVEAYARAEVATADLHTATVEYLRVPEAYSGQLEEAVRKADARSLELGGQDRACAGELTCVPVRVERVDPRTLRITRRWDEVQAPSERDAAAESRCAALLKGAEDALEVSARSATTPRERSELEATETLLLARDGYVERVTRRHFRSPALAARALRQVKTGGEEMPRFLGAPVPVTHDLRGQVLEERARISVDDLSLALADQERLAEALHAERAPYASAPDSPERALAEVKDALAALPGEEPARTALLLALDRRLSAARRAHPRSEPLARQHYDLRLTLLKNPRGALAIAEQQHASGGDASYWQLATRAALAWVDEPRLRAALARAYGLKAAEAASMARVLADQVRAGENYERAEWAVTTAHTLAARKRKSPMARVAPEPWALAQLPRLLSVWARLSSVHGRRDLGVHIVAFGTRAHAEPAPEAGLWAADTRVSGRAASVLSAATWEDSQLLAQGRALRARFAPGPLELWVGLDAIEEVSPATRRGTLLSFSGELREDGTFIVREVTRSLAGVDFARVRAYLAEPLSRLGGAVFPPDPLELEARNEEDLARLIQAAELGPEVRCAATGLALRCAGAPHDGRAAFFALLRVARALLGPDAEAPWAGE